MSKPKIILSKCFSQPVRYNGGIVNDDFVNALKEHIHYLDLCPEVEIGLGVPRKRLIVVDENSQKKLFQPETGRDFTAIIEEYSKKTVSSLCDIDGFILKAKSPSCGVLSTKLYRGEAVIGKTSGFFAETVRAYFPYLPIEDEGRLRDSSIRTHFLIRIFAFAELRELLSNASPKKLIDFHSKYKYLIMTYSQKSLKELGQLVADGKMSFDEKLSEYREKFYIAFLRKPSTKRHVNTLLHMIGHISKKLNKKEKAHLLSLIEKFSNGKIQLKVIIELIKSLAYRFEEEYILFQKYLEPYPELLNLFENN